MAKISITYNELQVLEGKSFMTIRKEGEKYYMAVDARSGVNIIELQPAELRSIASAIWHLIEEKGE